MPGMKLVNGVVTVDAPRRTPSLPPIPVQGDPQQRRFNEALRNAITGMYSGDGRFAIAAEVPSLANPAPTPGDDAIPPAPSGLTADGAFENIILSWDYPDSSAVAYTRIYRATVDDFTQAAVIGNTEGKVWADPVGPDQSFYYWVTNVSPSGVESPPNAVAGTLGQTAPNVELLLQELEGQVLKSTLVASLQDDIDALESAYTVKINSEGRIAGFGLAVENGVSQFAILADQFAVVIPGVAGGTPKVPFIVTTINGSPGVGISSAFIGDAAITNAKIANAAVDNAKIASLSAAKITFGTMSGARIDVNTLSADAIITSTLVAKLAVITDAYIVNANIENLTIGGEKFQANAVSNCAYMTVANAGSGGSFTVGTWVDWDTAVSGGGSGTGAGTGGSGGGGFSGGTFTPPVTSPGGGAIP